MKHMDTGAMTLTLTSLADIELHVTWRSLRRQLALLHPLLQGHQDVLNGRSEGKCQGGKSSIQVVDADEVLYRDVTFD